MCARVVRADGAVLIEQRPRGGLWGGLWQPPTIECADGEGLGAAAAGRLLALDLTLEPAGVVPFATTHRAVKFVVFGASVRGAGRAVATGGRRWVAAKELEKFALSNAAKRVLG